MIRRCQDIKKCNEILQLIILFMFCPVCSNYGLSGDYCLWGPQSYRHAQEINENINFLSEYPENLKTKAQIPTTITQAFQSHQVSLKENSPADQDSEVQEEDIEPITPQRRGRKIKDKGFRARDFPKFFKTQLNSSFKGPINNQTFEDLVHRYEKNMILSKLKEIASEKWNPGFRGTTKQVEAKKVAFRWKAREFFDKYKKEQWDPPKPK